MLEIKVRLFAAAAERAGVRHLHAHLPGQANLSVLTRQLVQLSPELEPLVATSRWAVDCEFIESDFIFDRDVTVAMIPPVSGG